MVAEFDRMVSAPIALESLELAELKFALQNNALALSTFVKNINYLEVQQHAIDVNLHNYEKYV